MSKRFCRESGHDFLYTKYTDNHEFLVCTLCGVVFLDTRNRLTYEEKRDLIKMLLMTPFIIGGIWLFIVMAWAAFG